MGYYTTVPLQNLARATGVSARCGRARATLAFSCAGIGRWKAKIAPLRRASSSDGAKAKSKDLSFRPSFAPGFAFAQPGLRTPMLAAPNLFLTLSIRQVL